MGFWGWFWFNLGMEWEYVILSKLVFDSTRINVNSLTHSPTMNTQFESGKALPPIFSFPDPLSQDFASAMR